MNNVKLVFWFLFLAFFQAIVVDQFIFFDRFIPSIALLFLIIYPFNAPIFGLIWWAFLFGFVLDLLTMNLGMQAFAFTCAAYFRSFLLKISLGVSYEYQVANIFQVTNQQKAVFIILLIGVHHLILYSLEAFSWTKAGWVLSQTLVSGLFSLGVCLGVLYLLKPIK